eukprot:scaffold7242_cov400-Prasinococcus_capsulatus_cf.AAC.4
MMGRRMGERVRVRAESSPHPQRRRAGGSWGRGGGDGRSMRGVTATASRRGAVAAESAAHAARAGTAAAGCCASGWLVGALAQGPATALRCAALRSARGAATWGGRPTLRPVG